MLRAALYQFVDTANWPWPTSVAPRRVSSGRAARGPVAPRKMACRPLAGKASISGSRPSTRAEGAAWSLPLLIGGRKWMPSRATSLCSPSCRCPAQSPPGRGIETFLARCFLPSVQSQCSVRPMGSGADMDKDYLTLRRASASRLSGEWGDDDYDALADDRGWTGQRT